MSKQFLSFIRVLQQTLLGAGVATLLILPIVLTYAAERLPSGFLSMLFSISLVSVTFVMIIRPLADMLFTIPQVRALVILRKGFGVFSASIIVAIMLSRIMQDPGGYFSAFMSPEHWSLVGYAVLAPLGDLSAVLLLITSNKYSKRVLGPYWKRIQKLAYVYFYAGALYEYLVFGQAFALMAIIIVTLLVLAAYIRNRSVRVVTPQTA